MFRLKVIYGMLFLYISSILFSIELKLVASPRIELGSGASETLILSPSDWCQPGGHCTTRPNYFTNTGALVVNTFTAIVSKITPKNFRTVNKPALPNGIITGFCKCSYLKIYFSLKKLSSCERYSRQFL